jgi:hypothetical protein
MTGSPNPKRSKGDRELPERRDNLKPWPIPYEEAVSDLLKVKPPKKGSNAKARRKKSKG